MTKTLDNTLSTASVLAFERKLDPSDAMLYAGTWDDRAHPTLWHPVPLHEKSVRGTISNRFKTKDQDPAKVDAAMENPNLQTVDVAALPPDADTLVVQFTLRVLPGVGTPSACNSAPYQSRLMDVVRQYVDAHGFAELARRYALNLANARFLWRNRLGAEAVTVEIARLEQGQAAQTWTFDALALDTRSFNTPVPDNVAELADVVASGLRGKSHVLLRVTAWARQGRGQEVFPSQELILDRTTGHKSKTLYQIDQQAAIHSQKIGNALRTIDTWYEGADALGPIAAEPYGSVTTQGKAYRQPRQKLDFYTLLDNWVLHDNAPATEQQHYVMAILIRGGVFGESK